MKVYKIDFVINPSAYFLGCSPDRRVYDPSIDEYGFLEIKCPSNDKVSDCKCLKMLNTELSLKRSHDYFYQIMGQLGITGLAWCDFFIMTTVDYHKERIFFDIEVWHSMSHLIFFTSYIFCHILQQKLKLTKISQSYGC